jgi:hypothetical protein
MLHWGKLTALSVGGIFTKCDLLWMMILPEAAQFLREFRIAVCTVVDTQFELYKRFCFLLSSLHN